MWIEKSTYWIHSGEQGTDEWKRIRLGRITASDFGTVAGWSHFTKPDELLPYLTGELTKSDNENMSHGRTFEPIVRNWYSHTRNVPVTEGGLTVPKWDFHIGCSLDGEVENNGMIEIKCPQKMYLPLKNHKKHQPGFSHIWKTHYAQMQGCMAITNKSWCDYIVYCDSEQQIYTERIPFDQSYWNNLYHHLKSYYSKHDSILSSRRIDPS